jgi:hypothetical protein
MLGVVDPIAFPKNLRNDRDSVDASVNFGLEAIVCVLLSQKTRFDVFAELG